MADALQSQTMARFLGVDNVNNPIRLTPIVANHEYVYPLAQANNMEIDNTYGLASRSGYATVAGSAGTSGLDNHSGWSDGDTCLYIDGAILYELTKSYDRIALRSDLTLGMRMSYAKFNDRIYYTNEKQIGYVKSNTDNSLPNPDREFKEPLPPGQLIEYFMGCLYVARGNILYISDPLCDYYDIRTGYRQFAKRMTMLRAVDEGLYASDDRIWFVKGKGSDEFQRDEVYPSRAIQYTDVRVAGKYIDDGIVGNVALWTSENGICLGDNSGKVTNLTEERYTFSPTGRGAAVIRENQGIRHYVNSLY